MLRALPETPPPARQEARARSDSGVRGVKAAVAQQRAVIHVRERRADAQALEQRGRAPAHALEVGAERNLRVGELRERRGLDELEAEREAPLAGVLRSLLHERSTSAWQRACASVTAAGVGAAPLGGLNWYCAA